MDSAPTLRLGPRALDVSLRPYDARDEDAAIALAAQLAGRLSAD